MRKGSVLGSFRVDRLIDSLRNNSHNVIIPKNELSNVSWEGKKEEREGFSSFLVLAEIAAAVGSSGFGFLVLTIKNLFGTSRGLGGCVMMCESA